MRKKVVTRDGWQVIKEYEFFKIFSGNVFPMSQPPSPGFLNLKRLETWPDFEVWVGGHLPRDCFAPPLRFYAPPLKRHALPLGKG